MGGGGGSGGDGGGGGCVYDALDALHAAGLSLSTGDVARHPHRLGFDVVRQEQHAGRHFAHVLGIPDC